MRAKLSRPTQFILKKVTITRVNNNRYCLGVDFLKRFFICRVAATFFCFLLMLTFVCSCSGDKNTDAAELLLDICEENGVSKTKGIFYVDETRNQPNEDFYVISSEELGYLYSGKFEPPLCLSRIESVALRLPLDESGCEIHVIKCLNPSDTDEISVMLQSRIDRLQSAEILSFAPETYEMYFRGAKIYTKGCFAFLIATPDNESVIKQIKEFL